MIGIFDSGFGGLTVFKEIEKQLPNHDYIYLGDNKRAPYGNCNQGTIYEYTKQAVDYLFAQGCNLIILACNTASASALRRIQQEYLPVKYIGKNVLGVIRPIAEEISQLQSQRVAVMGTISTVRSRAYIAEFKRQNPSIEVTQQACPLLVPLIEKSWEGKSETELVVKEHVADLQEAKPDTVVLGCTHYAWLHSLIQKHFGKKVKVLDCAPIIAKKLEEYLERHKGLVAKSKKKKRIFLTTNSTEGFDKAAEKWLGRKIKSKKVEL